MWQKWQMFAVCWVFPLMDSSAAALFVASPKNPTALVCNYSGSAPSQFQFYIMHYVFCVFLNIHLLHQTLKGDCCLILIGFQAELHCGDWELRVHSLRRRHVLAGWAGGGGGGEPSSILFVFLYFCICVFLYLVVEVNLLLFYLYFCIWWCGGGGESYISLSILLTELSWRGGVCYWSNLENLVVFMRFWRF